MLCESEHHSTITASYCFDTVKLKMKKKPALSMGQPMDNAGDDDDGNDNWLMLTTREGKHANVHSFLSLFFSRFIVLAFICMHVHIEIWPTCIT